MRRKRIRPRFPGIRDTSLYPGVHPLPPTALPTTQKSIIIIIEILTKFIYFSSKFDPFTSFSVDLVSFLAKNSRESKKEKNQNIFNHEFCLVYKKKISVCGHSDDERKEVNKSLVTKLDFVKKTEGGQGSFRYDPSSCLTLWCWSLGMSHLAAVVGRQCRHFLTRLLHRMDL